MYQELALLVDRNAARVFDGFSLGVKLLGNSFVASASYSPALTMWNYMLVFACHDRYLGVTMVEVGGFHHLPDWATALQKSRRGPVFAAYILAAPPMLEGHTEHCSVAWRWSWGSAHGEYLLSEVVDTTR